MVKPPGHHEPDVHHGPDVHHEPDVHAGLQRSRSSAQERLAPVMCNEPSCPFDHIFCDSARTGYKTTMQLLHLRLLTAVARSPSLSLPRLATA